MATQGQDDGTLSHLFDRLIDLVGEAKQALWSAGSVGFHVAVDSLKHFLEEQAALIDEAVLRDGGRPPSFVTPTAHKPRNISEQANGDPAAVIDLLVGDLTDLLDELKGAASTEGTWQTPLSELASGIERHLDELRDRRASDHEKGLRTGSSVRPQHHHVVKDEA